MIFCTKKCAISGLHYPRISIANRGRRRSALQYTVPSRRAAPESCKSPSARKRAWGMPDAQCTLGLVCNDSGRTHTSNNEHTGITRHSRTQWF
jgi:hypothetical protein